jgi:hypothetical protein
MKKAAVVGSAIILAIAGLGMFLGPIVLTGNLSTMFDLAGVNRADWRSLSEIAYDNATAGLGDSYIHFVSAQKASLWQFGFLADVADLPLDLFPSRLWGFQKGRNSMLDLTTEFIAGHQLPEDVTGDEPLGLHGYLLVNFGYPGMFVLFLALGAFYKWIHNRFLPASSKDAVGWLIYWWFVLGFFVYLREGMLLFVLKDQLTWWLTAAFLIKYRAIVRPRNTNINSRGEALAHFDQH